MIDKKELRIGNLVVLAHESNAPVATIEEIRRGGAYVHHNPPFSMASWSSFERLMPIELNPEWLQKCGLIDPAKNGLAYRMDINLADELCWYVQDGYLRYQTSLNGFTRPREHIKYVHQLQNFFYWHTGKELTIKSDNNVAL
jgi:hypothetical protein